MTQAKAAATDLFLQLRCSVQAAAAAAVGETFSLNHFSVPLPSEVDGHTPGNPSCLSLSSLLSSLGIAARRCSLLCIVGSLLH